MRSWSTRRWRKGSPRFSARCPPGPDVVWTDTPTRTSCPAPSRWAGAGAGVEVAGELVRDRAEDRRVGAAEFGEPAVALEDMVAEVVGIEHLRRDEDLLAQPLRTIGPEGEDGLEPGGAEQVVEDL